MLPRFNKRRNVVMSDSVSEYSNNYISAFNKLQAYALEREPDNPKSDHEIAEILQNLTVSEIKHIAETGRLTDSARSNWAMPAFPDVARPLGLPSSRLGGALKWIGGLYSFSETLPDVVRKGAETIEDWKGKYRSVRQFGKDVISEITGSGNNGGSKMGIRVTESKATAGADARYLKVKEAGLDYNSGPLVDFNSPAYMQPVEITSQSILDSSTHYFTEAGGHFETPLMLQVVNWVPAWRDEVWGETPEQRKPDPRDYIAYVADQVFLLLNTVEIQQSINFRLPKDWSAVNLYKYIVTCLDALQILVDVNVIRIAYLENKQMNVGINQLAALLSNEELSLLDALEIKLNVTYLPKVLTEYFWTISQFMTLEDVSDSTVCKFIGTHAVCEDPKVRVANIEYLLDAMTQPWFIAVQGLFTQCDAKGCMLSSWTKLTTIPIGFGTPKYSAEYTWLWANNAVVMIDDTAKKGTFLPMCSDVEHSVYASTRIDEIDLFYLLSAAIPFADGGDPKKLHTHMNAIMIPHPVTCKASGPSKSCSILYSGHNGLECIDPGPKAQPMTGNIHLSGINSGGLLTPTAYPGWKRIMYYSIQHRDQYMKQFVSLITSLSASGSTGKSDMVATASGGTKAKSKKSGWKKKGKLENKNTPKTASNSSESDSSDDSKE